MSRTIVIGDVHGCSVELADLLQELKVKTTDRVYFVGDLIGRGPDSRGVLQRVRELSAVAVQGNHERRLIEVHESGEAGRRSRLGPAHRRLLQTFTDEDWQMMLRMPLFVELPEHEMCIAHAGIDPAVPMSKQDPWVLTHLRSFDETGAPSHHDGSQSWASTYAGPLHVTFGHNAIRGLQIHPHATGLDTGCVYGGHLSALVLGKHEKVPAQERRRRSIVSVKSRHRYFNPNH